MTNTKILDAQKAELGYRKRETKDTRLQWATATGFKEEHVHDQSKSTNQ